MLWIGILLNSSAQAAAQLVVPQSDMGKWLVTGPQEIVGWFAFDPAPVIDRVPEFVRFVTVGELANDGVSWAVDYMAHHVTHERWGVSFLEIVRADTFAIDGREPVWPQNGAAAVWFARVLPKTDIGDLGPGLPLLVLEFWVPDSAYAAFMHQRGYYATYADVRLSERNDKWQGFITAADFAMRVLCTPASTESGGSNSRGFQVLIPPKDSGLATVVPIAFEGHRERKCSESSSWTIEGRHPLTGAVALDSASFQYGYRLTGRTHNRAFRP
jgi:hypothetical protein